MINLKMKECTVVFYIFDGFNKFFDLVMLKKTACGDSVEYERCDCISRSDCPKSFAAAFNVDGYFLSVFTRVLFTSSTYSRLVMNNFINIAKRTVRNDEISAKFRLVEPKLEIIDYAWNDRIGNLVFERQELEHAMSWLSTLGGAFSALGDNFENCAKVAGKISIQQFKIAFRLGEPMLVARCRLYMALSLIQLGNLKTAKFLVKEQFLLGKTFNDFRLQNMCKGVWAKLQYISKKKKQCN